ncbi:MAG: hypothetical protein AAF587_12495 [Bacteroidota bacterium]
MNPIYLCVFSICSIFLIYCHPIKSKKPSPSDQLLQIFPTTSLSDTLHVWREAFSEKAHIPIPDSVLQAASVDSLLAVISPYASDIDELGGIYAISQFDLSHHTRACLVQIHYSWYRHLGILLWEKDRHRFTSAVQLSLLDGGDGGQALTESWLFDWDGDGDHDQLLRTHTHAMIPTEEGDGFRELDEDHVALFIWDKETFQPSPLPDTTGLIARFQIDW